jgi:membrane protein
MGQSRKKGLQSLLKAAGTIAGYAALHALLTPTVRESNPASHRAPFGAEGSPGEFGESHRERAVQSGRGRDAVSPWQIPWRGWKDIFWRTLQQVQDDRLLAIAAGVVFYGLLALFPALTVIVSLYGLFAQPATIENHIVLISDFVPEQAVAIIREQIERLVARDIAQLSFGFLLGFGIALWSANAGVKAIIDALNVVYEEREKRSFVRLNLISFVFTMGAIAAVLLAIGAVVVAPFLLDRIWFGDELRRLIEFGRWPTLIAVLLIGLACLYRFGPSRVNAKWRWLSVGSVAAVILWVAGSALFSFYIQNYANFDATYGSLGTGIGLMLWMWMSVIVILFGAELNAEIEHQTAQDSTRGAARPLGKRGAAMADTVGRSSS